MRPRPPRPTGVTQAARWFQWAHDSFNELQQIYGPGILTSRTGRGVMQEMYPQKSSAREISSQLPFLVVGYYYYGYWFDYSGNLHLWNTTQVSHGGKIWARFINPFCWNGVATHADVFFSNTASKANNGAPSVAYPCQSKSLQNAEVRAGQLYGGARVARSGATGTYQIVDIEIIQSEGAAFFSVGDGHYIGGALALPNDFENGSPMRFYVDETIGSSTNGMGFFVNENPPPVIGPTPFKKAPDLPPGYPNIISDDYTLILEPYP